jgi:hypothetical protein
MLIIGFLQQTGRYLKLAASCVGGVDVWVVDNPDSYLV